jgi:Fic family protein
LERLGAQALQEVNRLASVNQTLVQIAAELNRVEAAMRQLGGSGAADVAAPINRLVQAIALAADKADASSSHIERLQGDLRTVSEASLTLGKQLSSSVAGPLTAHERALNLMHQQLEEMARQLGPISLQLIQAQTEETVGESKLIKEAEALRISMDETNRQLHSLLDRVSPPIAESSGGETLRRLPNAGPESSSA